MIPPRPSDISLYELATGQADSSILPLQISPTTFKALVSTVIDLLLEQEIAATLWMKLPRGDVWQAEIDRFCAEATAPYSLYNLQTYQRSGSVQSVRAPVPTAAPPSTETDAALMAAVSSRQAALIEDGELIGGEELALRSSLRTAPNTSVAPSSLVHNFPLAADSQLKREYFLMVISPQFQVLVLTHRPRTVRLKSDLPELSIQPSTPGSDDALEQKHPLLGLCSLDPSVLRPVLTGVNRAIRVGQPDLLPHDNLESLLVSWEQLVNQNQVGALNPAFVSYLLTKQVQRQEDVWRSGATYRRQAESATTLQQENEDLLNTLRLKDDFVKVMGQELRTPLTTMKTALSLLSSPTVKPQQRQRYMDLLTRECDRQSSLITSVLDLVQVESNLEQVSMESVQLAEILPSAVSTYQPIAQEKGLILGYTLPDDLPSVACTPQWLKQIVIHIIHNGIKFTPSGGQVWVKARAVGDFVYTEFRDTGIGIASADLPKIFDRFYRIRPTSGDAPSGAGLGLSIVQQLLLRCGGSISVKSKPDEGSVFSVSLPIYGSDRKSSSRSSSRGVGNKGKEEG